MCSVKLCKQANTAGKTARYKALLDTLQTTYYKFEEDTRRILSRKFVKLRRHLMLMLKRMGLK